MGNRGSVEVITHFLGLPVDLRKILGIKLLVEILFCPPKSRKSDCKTASRHLLVAVMLTPFEPSERVAPANREYRHQFDSITHSKQAMGNNEQN